MTQALALANVLRYGLVDNMGDLRERRETESGCQIALCRALSDAIAHLLDAFLDDGPFLVVFWLKLFPQIRFDAGAHLLGIKITAAAAFFTSGGRGVGRWTGRRGGLGEHRDGGGNKGQQTDREQRRQGTRQQIHGRWKAAGCENVGRVQPGEDAPRPP